jgi:hypothetical protein
MVMKFFLIIYLVSAFQKRKREDVVAGSDFLVAVTVLLFSLFLSRFFYMMFDFYYTKFDMNLYYLKPNVYFWQIGQCIASLGQGYLIYVVDKKILQNKFKGILAYIMIAGGIFQVAYPINSMDDFNFVSAMSIFSSLGFVILPFVFINIARKSSGELKRTAIVFVLGVIIYALGAIVVNAGLLNVINESTGKEYDVLMYYIQALSKITGMLLLAIASTKFKI